MIQTCFFFRCIRMAWHKVRPKGMQLNAQRSKQLNIETVCTLIGDLILSYFYQRGIILSNF